MSKNSIVISHRKDADGICSAALVKHMCGAQIFLSDYADMVETLAAVGKADDYYICDLATNSKTFPGFLEQATRLGSYGHVNYIDHHPLSAESRSKLTNAGVEIINSADECASVLVYKEYESKLKDSPQMKIAASCGAITDYMDSGPFAKKIISSFDRQFLLYEATLLSFTISMTGRGLEESNARLVQIANEIAGGKLPHEIENAPQLAQTHAEKSARLIQVAREKGKKMNNFAYISTQESATGNVAYFLIGSFDVPVGLAYREEGSDYYEISIRSVEESRHDLGKIASKVAAQLNASGGGHQHASGARIKRNQLESFLSLLDQELARATVPTQ